MAELAGCTRLTWLGSAGVRRRLRIGRICCAVPVGHRILGCCSIVRLNGHLHRRHGVRREYARRGRNGDRQRQ